jgi:hypothetical protein
MRTSAGLADGADRGRFGDAGDEPVALVVAAEEFRLLAILADQEQQMAVGGLHVKDGDVRISARRADNLEEFALAVGLNVEGYGAGRAGATTRVIGELEARADA